MEAKPKTTNYFNTFVEVAEDCSAVVGLVPPLKEGKRTVANIQFEMLINNPYRYTSDDVLFAVHASRNNLQEQELEDERRKFFSKGQACFRASPLTKTYGWGVHFDAQGKMALYGLNSDEYQRFAKDPSLQHYKAMRSKKLRTSARFHCFWIFAHGKISRHASAIFKSTESRFAYTLY